MTSLQCYLLGSPRIEWEGVSLDLGRRKALALFAYLAVERQTHNRETLATLFWPDYSQRDARTDLARMLSVLRRTLGEQWFASDRQTISLSLQADLWVDVHEFQLLLTDSDAHDYADDEICSDRLSNLTRAATLYQADFMAGFTLVDSPEFDDWQSLRTHSLRQDLANVLEKLVGIYTGRSEYEPAIQHAQRWLALDPLHEPAHRQLMLLYAWSDQHAAALRQYHLCVKTLKDELDVPPSAETTALYEQVRTGEVSGGTRMYESRAVINSPPQPSSSSAPPHNLPSQATSFVGRADTLTDIVQRLHDPACRLLTLVGPGGIGKTRLAVQAATNLIENNDAVQFVDGVYFVSLAPIGAADFLVFTIADALDFSFYGEGDPRAQLFDYLRKKTMLLILDNFEHLLSPEEQDHGAQLVSDILVHAPALKLLVTSRERLNLQAEWLYPVSGMLYPEEESTEAADPKGYSAVQLFIQRAQQVQPGFHLARELDEVVRVCQLVEGMPLGIELAASWLSSFTCSQISQEIRCSLDFLSTRLRDLPARHRSMRAVFESSWKLLTEKEQSVLSRVSVFRGGFERTAAETVAEATWPVLTMLVEKSVLHLTPSGRYQMHEVLRQFAAEKLVGDKGAQAATQDRFCDYYFTFLQQREDSLHGKEQPVILAEIQTEIENMRAAWSWAVEQSQVEAIERVLDSLHSYYDIRNEYRIGQETYELALASLSASPDPLSQRLRGKLLARLADVSATLGGLEQAQEQIQAGLTIARRLDDRPEVAFCLIVWSRVMYDRRSFADAQQLAQEGLSLSREIKDQLGIATALTYLGSIAADQTRYADARAYYEESLAMSRILGHADRVAHALAHMGYINFIEGAYAESEAYYQESLAMFREIGDRLGMAGSLDGLAQNLAWGQKPARLIEAKLLFEESLAINREIGHRDAIARELYWLGNLCLEQEAHEEAQAHALDLLSIAEAMGAWERIVSHQLLGDVATSLGDFSGARHHFWHVLTLALETQESIPILAVLRSYGNLLLKEGTCLKRTTSLHHEELSQNRADMARQKHSLVVEYLTLVMYHPGSSQIMKDRAARHLAELETKLSPVEMAAAAARGQDRDLETTVAEMLAVLTEDELDSKRNTRHRPPLS